MQSEKHDGKSIRLSNAVGIIMRYLIDEGVFDVGDHSLNRLMCSVINHDKADKPQNAMNGCRTSSFPVLSDA